MMEASSSLLCHGMYGNIDSILSEDAIYVNSWCQGAYSSTTSTGTQDSVSVRIHHRAAREVPVDVPGARRCNSLLDDDVEVEHQHYRIFSSHQHDGTCTTRTGTGTSTRQGHDAQDSEFQHENHIEAHEHIHIHTNADAETQQDHAPLSASTSESTQYLSSSASEVVLNEAIMEELQDHLPFCKRGESFWQLYSMVKDGASLDSLLAKVRNSESTILAVETVEGEVFGAFCPLSWKQSNDYYGSGQSFLWRLDGKQKVQVFKFAFINHNIQLCQPDRLIVGGGGGDTLVAPPPSLSKVDSSSTLSAGSASGSISIPQDSTLEWGFGLWLEQDLLRGSSSPCLTFQSPSLSHIHADGSPFEVRNLEVWALTPCISVEQALHNQRRRQLLSGGLIPKALSLMENTTSTTPSLFGLSER